MGEFELIQRFVSRLKFQKRDVLLGPGDDAAAVRLGPAKILLTTDLLIEGVHFRRNWLTPEEIGFKAMRVNLSDIAAMGGRPRFALVSLGLPAGLRGPGAERLFRGLRRAAEEAGVAIVGGDTNASGRLAVNVALVGEPGPRLLTRSGAIPGDGVYVTGSLGGSALGLAVLRKGRGEGRPSGLGAFVRRHKRPPDRVLLGLALARMGGVHAMIDLSDGLAGDLPHVLRASRAGAEIEVGKVPSPPGFASAASAVGKDPLSLILAGGEDYELLFTASSRVKMPPKINGVPISKIGMITPASGGLRWVRSGGKLTRRSIDLRGFRHF